MDIKKNIYRNATLLMLCVICSTHAVAQIRSVAELKSPLKKAIVKSSALTASTDSVPLEESFCLKLYKKTAHASYYSDRFNGRKTASGSRFSNKEYTAAHKKLPFGTKVKVTNEANGKFVILKITDRGPFVKMREIDLSKLAFMEITENKNAGKMLVTIEILENKLPDNAFAGLNNENKN